jgi:curved DNA-binding protein CbpA
VDARQVLGIGPDAGDQEIRAAYLRKVKEHPPDHSPEEFEKIRDAYNTLSDPRRRMRDLLTSGNPLEPFAALIDSVSGPRRFVDPQLWLEVLKSK